MKSSPRIIQELKILGYRHDVLAVVPLPPNLEVAEDFPRNIRFKRPFYQGAEAVFSRSKMGVLGCDVQKTKSFQLPEQPLIGVDVTCETGRPFEPGIHKAQGDHRGSPWERRGKEERKFIYKIANRRTTTRSTLINLGWK